MLDEMLPSNLLAEFVARLYRHQKTDAASPLVSSGKVFCVRHMGFHFAVLFSQKRSGASSVWWLMPAAAHGLCHSSL